MPRSESEEKFYQEHLLPIYEKFHAENPLFWVAKQQRLAEASQVEVDKNSLIDDPVPWLVEDETTIVELDDKIEPDLPVDEIPPTNPRQLGKKFLDATNVWKLRPELQPLEKLSSEGRLYLDVGLDDVRWVVNKAKETLIASEGTADLGTIMISGDTQHDYLNKLRAKIIDDEEYYYLSGIINEMIRGIEELRLQILFYKQVGKPMPTNVTMTLNRPYQPFPRKK